MEAWLKKKNVLSYLWRWHMGICNNKMLGVFITMFAPSSRCAVLVPLRMRVDAFSYSFSSSLFCSSSFISLLWEEVRKKEKKKASLISPGLFLDMYLLLTHWWRSLKIFSVAVHVLIVCDTYLTICATYDYVTMWSYQRETSISVLKRIGHNSELALSLGC